MNEAKPSSSLFGQTLDAKQELYNSIRGYGFRVPSAFITKVTEGNAGDIEEALVLMKDTGLLDQDFVDWAVDNASVMSHATSVLAPMGERGLLDQAGDLVAIDGPGLVQIEYDVAHLIEDGNFNSTSLANLLREYNPPVGYAP